MAKLPAPLWKSDPIGYLVQRRFPLSGLSVLEQREGRKSADAAAKNKERANEANAYRLHLETLAPARLSELVAKTQADDSRLRQERADFEEQQRTFNQPFARADFAYWASASYWSQDEAVALSFGRDPRHVTWKAIEPFENVSAFARSFADRREIVRRAIVMGQLFNLTIPTFFLAWAKRVRLEMPKEMTEEIEKLGLQIGDWKTIADQRQEIIDRHEERIRLADKRNTELSEVVSNFHDAALRASERVNASLAVKDNQIAELESRMNSGTNMSAASRERQSLLRLVIGMAIGGYGFDPKASRTATAREIGSDLQLRGLALDEDTIRKYLNEAKEQLPGGIND